MVATLKRCARETEDWLRYHPRVRDLLSLCQTWGDRLRPAMDPQDVARSIVRRCAAARWARDSATIAALQKGIHARLAELDEKRLDWTEFAPQIGDGRIAKAAILKPYLGPREKGVVFISFENQWIKLLRHGDLHDFAARYHLVLSPSGSPHNLSNYVFAAAYPGPLFSLISNAGDLDALPGVSDKFIVVPLYASSWVNPARFAPKPRPQRNYDLIMVANFAKFKRHHVLFRALRSLPCSLRILLIGQNQDARTAASVEEEARWYGVAGRFDLRVNQSYPEVTSAFCDSRASVILSRREGSCVVVAESMFADAPVAVLENAELGSRAFINPQTGVFVREVDLAAQISDLIQRADRFSPRQWAEANISCWKSSERLNAIVKNSALAHGERWTRDLAPLQWCPDPEPVHAEDRTWIAAERNEIKQRFGLMIGPELTYDEQGQREST